LSTCARAEVLKGLKDPVTADELAAITGRASAVESMYLNVLHRRDLLMRERRGRHVFFSLKEDHKNGSV